MKLRKSRPRRRGRIEIIPMIDVMLFLLAAFMLASLSMQHLHSLPVNLPHGTAMTPQIRHPLTLTVTKEGGLFIEQVPVSLEALAGVLREKLPASTGEVTVAADSAAPHGVVVDAMLAARLAGVEHFLIAVKHD